MAETILVIGIISAAAGYLAWGLYRRFTRGACGCSCDQCGDSDQCGCPTDREDTG